MQRYLYFLMFLGLASACEKRTTVRKDNPNPDFLTSPDGTLFFKNVRQIAYNRSQPKEIKMTLYTHKEVPVLKGQAQVWAYLAENWQYQEAYFMLQANKEFGDFTENRFSYFYEGDSSYHSFQAMRYFKPEFLRFADFAVKAFETESELFLIFPSGDSVEIFQQEAEREAFRVTLKDYKKWVNGPGN